jgi:hypothetical protein
MGRKQGEGLNKEEKLHSIGRKKERIGQRSVTSMGASRKMEKVEGDGGHLEKAGVHDLEGYNGDERGRRSSRSRGR